MTDRKKLDMSDFKMITLEEMKKDHPEILNKAKEQIFVCMMCGKENKGITFCDHILEEEE